MNLRRTDRFRFDMFRHWRLGERRGSSKAAVQARRRFKQGGGSSKAGVQARRRGSQHFELIVNGPGPDGRRAAGRAAKVRKSVLVVERGRPIDLSNGPLA